MVILNFNEANNEELGVAQSHVGHMDSCTTCFYAVRNSNIVIVLNPGDQKRFWSDCKLLQEGLSCVARRRSSTVFLLVINIRVKQQVGAAVVEGKWTYVWVEWYHPLS